MSTPKNNITRSVRPASIFPSAQGLVDANTNYNQGDWLIIESNKIIVPDTEDDGDLCLGIATETVVAGKLKSPYSTDVDGSTAIADLPGPTHGVVAKMILKPSDSLSPGALVYMDPVTHSRGVAASGTKAVGVYQGVAAVTGGPSTAFTEVEVLIGHRFPGDTLAF